MVNQQKETKLLRMSMKINFIEIYQNQIMFGKNFKISKTLRTAVKIVRKTFYFIDQGKETKMLMIFQILINLKENSLKQILKTVKNKEFEQDSK
jgi:hypothetical protein